MSQVFITSLKKKRCKVTNKNFDLVEFYTKENTKEKGLIKHNYRALCCNKKIKVLQKEIDKQFIKIDKEDLSRKSLLSLNVERNKL